MKKKGKVNVVRDHNATGCLLFNLTFFLACGVVFLFLLLTVGKRGWDSFRTTPTFGGGELLEN